MLIEKANIYTRCPFCFVEHMIHENNNISCTCGAKYYSNNWYKGKEIKEYNNIEPRFRLENDSGCYGCPMYVHFSNAIYQIDRIINDQIDNYGGMCDCKYPCNYYQFNNYKGDTSHE